MEPTLPPIPAKRYFTIGEVGELCAVKPHVLRYWEQEFTQLRPMKRQGNRRYYQHHEVLMIRRIRELLYEQGFSINGARQKLQQASQKGRHGADHPDGDTMPLPDESTVDTAGDGGRISADQLEAMLRELREIRFLLSVEG